MKKNLRQIRDGLPSGETTYKHKGVVFANEDEFLKAVLADYRQSHPHKRKKPVSTAHSSVCGPSCASSVHTWEGATVAGPQLLISRHERIRRVREAADAGSADLSKVCTKAAVERFKENLELLLNKFLRDLSYM